MTQQEPMDSGIRELWARFVENPNRYNLGTGFLCRNTRDRGELYDPLGILCELAVLDGVSSWRWMGDLNMVQYKLYGQDSGVLPYSVQRWAGLSTYDPRFALTMEQRAKLNLPARYFVKTNGLRPVPLSHINDHGTVTRATLAALIRTL